MEYYRLKYRQYGISASSRSDAVRRGVEMIKKDLKSFVVDAEPYTDRRPIWKRLIFGDQR